MCNNVLDAPGAANYTGRMDYESITPQDIERMAVDARKTLSEVLAKAGVSRGAFYRAKRGDGKMLPLTKARLIDAIGIAGEDA